MLSPAGTTRKAENDQRWAGRRLEHEDEPRHLADVAGGSGLSRLDTTQPCEGAPDDRHDQQANPGGRRHRAARGDAHPPPCPPGQVQHRLAGSRAKGNTGWDLIVLSRRIEPAL